MTSSPDGARGQLIPMLGDVQRRTLDLILDIVLKTRRWPKYAYVDQELYSDDVDLDAVLESLPLGLFEPDRRYSGSVRLREDDDLRLTIRGVACCSRSEKVVPLFLQTIRWAIEARKDFRMSSPHEVERRQWSLVDVTNGVGLKAFGELSMARPALVVRLMENEPDLLRWSGPPDDPTDWRIDIPREIRRYAGINSIEDFLQEAHPVPAEEHLPPANPFVFPAMEPVLQTTGERDASAAGDLSALHPSIQEAASRLFESGHYGHAVLEACKAINVRVKRMSSLQADGQALMSKAFSVDRPVLRLNPRTNESERDVQQGLMYMLMGLMTGIRNPLAHELDLVFDPYEAYEHLAFTSLLMRRLDEVVPNDDR